MTLSRLLARIQRHLEWRLGRVRQSIRAAAVVDQRWAYLMHDLFAGRRIGTYTVGGRSVTLTHGTQDVQIFQEIFDAGYYDLPAELEATLMGGEATLRVADLGGNIGMFGLWVALHWPAADVTAFEPDPVNAAKYRALLHVNGLDWTLVEACAAAADGSVRFSAGLESGSKQSAEGNLEVPAVDAFDVLGEAHVIKMDIEGGEWELLLDPRFADLEARIVVMEYHPHLCPERDAEGLAIRVLRDAGYDVSSIFHAPQGHGMLRALRPT